MARRPTDNSLNLLATDHRLCQTQYAKVFGGTFCQLKTVSICKSFPKSISSWRLWSARQLCIYHINNANVYIDASAKTPL